VALWQRFGVLAIGAALILLGGVIARWGLVDPDHSSTSFILPASVQMSGLITPSKVVGWALVACGLVVVAMWLGIVIGRGRAGRAAVEEADAEVPRTPRVRRLSIGILLMVVGALLLSFPSIGGVWSDIWFSTQPGNFIFYSVFQYFPVVVTVGLVAEVVGLCLSLVAVRRLVRGQAD
jgi:hypothetical protein